MAAGIIGYGSSLKYDSGGGTYVALANVMDIPEEPGITVPGADGTSNDSPSGAREMVPGLIEQKKPKFTLRYDKTVFNTVWGFAIAKAIKNWKLFKPDGSGHGPFTAWVSDIGGKYKLDGVLVFDIELTQDQGLPTFATALS
jgi:hypothetical protein